MYTFIFPFTNGSILGRIDCFLVIPTDFQRRSKFLGSRWNSSQLGMLDHPVSKTLRPRVVLGLDLDSGAEGLIDPTLTISVIFLSSLVIVNSAFNR